MIAFESPVSYKLIYVFTIHDKDHEGYLKIGEATLKTAYSEAQLPPSCDLLNQAAHKRSGQYTKTAVTSNELLYTELAQRAVKLNDGSIRLTSFSDRDVHDVLFRSRYAALKFPDSGRNSEWFPISLEIAQNAIKAVKE